MSNVKRVVRGWIYIDGRRADDGSVEFGTGDELKLNPFEALSDKAAQVPKSAVLKASFQRLVFWKR
jgi:hypothetical protein